jgi:hypothetical protein
MQSGTKWRPQLLNTAGCFRQKGCRTYNGGAEPTFKQLPSRSCHGAQRGRSIEVHALSSARYNGKCSRSTGPVDAPPSAPEILWPLMSCPGSLSCITGSAPKKGIQIRWCFTRLFLTPRFKPALTGIWGEPVHQRRDPACYGGFWLSTRQVQANLTSMQEHDKSKQFQQLVI